MSFVADNDDDPRREMGHHGMTHPDDKDDSKEGIPIPPSKPKIWSMAELAVCKTPPPPNATHGNPWQAMQHGFGLDANLVRQNPAMAAAALRSNMFGMGRTQDPSTYPGLQGHNDSKVQHPSISPSVSALTGSSELQTETPPQTPPNGVKMGANLGMGNNVINMNNSGSPYQNPYQSQYGSSLNSSMHSFDESPNKNMGQYSNNSISNMSNNLYNGNVSRI